MNKLSTRCGRIRRRRRKQVFNRDKGICIICSKCTKKWEMDHIIGLVDGGTNKLSNLRTLCHHCHFLVTHISHIRQNHQFLRLVRLIRGIS